MRNEIPAIKQYYGNEGDMDKASRTERKNKRKKG